jgi:hypothetical protein
LRRPNLRVAAAERDMGQHLMKMRQALGERLARLLAPVVKPGEAFRSREWDAGPIRDLSAADLEPSLDVRKSGDQSVHFAGKIGGRALAYGFSYRLTRHVCPPPRCLGHEQRCMLRAQANDFRRPINRNPSARSAASRRQCNFVSQLAGRVGGPCDNPNGHGGRTARQPDADARGARNVESFRLPPTAPRRNRPSEKCSRLSTAVPMHLSKVTVFWFATPRRYGTSGRGVLSKQFQDKGIGGSALGSLQCFGDFS